jgi:hypothetical protein
MGVTITLGVAAPERLDLAFAFEDAERDLSLLGPKQAYEEGSVPAPLLPSGRDARKRPPLVSIHRTTARNPCTSPGIFVGHASAGGPPHPPPPTMCHLEGRESALPAEHLLQMDRGRVVVAYMVGGDPH